MNLNDFVVSALETARWLTVSAVEDLTDEEMMFQPADGLNHPLWLLGHIAGSENGLILGACKGQNLLPKGWMGKFGIGSQPVADPGVYPERDQILALLEKTHAAALDYVMSLAPEDLDDRPVEIDRFPPGAQERFSTVARCISGHVTHESSHVGQIAMLRRIMGKAPRV